MFFRDVSRQRLGATGRQSNRSLTFSLRTFLQPAMNKTVCRACMEMFYFPFIFAFKLHGNRGTKRQVSVNICSVEDNSASVFFSKVSPGIFVIKVK